VTTTEAPQLERASTAAPRPELDWERDWQGRPRILPDPTWTLETAPPGWVVDGQLLESREYTRVTTHAEALQDSSALTRWKMRRVALGAGRRPDYVMTAASLTAEDRDRDALDDVAEKMLEASGPNAADVGTALHAFTDRIDRGEELGAVPEQYVSTLDAYRHAISVLTFVEWECRTVCDELETAGTPDRLGFCTIPDPDGVTDALRIIDTKTGRVDYSAGKFSTQLAIYRRSRKYHPGTGARTSWEELHGKPVSRWGLVVHIPAGAGVAEPLWIDLEHGDRGAEVAQQVRQWRQGAKAGLLLRPMFARPPRPATTDGTCRGRKQDGTACGYRRKTKAEGLASQFCGRHADQAAHLERWLAENPDADPADGVEQLPSLTPVQPSFPPVQPPAETHLAGLQDTMADAAERFRAEAERRGVIVSEFLLPNGQHMAPPGARIMAGDGTMWVKVQRTDTFGWEREDRVKGAGGPELVRCAGTGLLVTQCACSVHRPEQADLTAAAFLRAQQAAAVTPDPERPARELVLPPLQSMPEQLAGMDWGDMTNAQREEHMRRLQEVAPPITVEEMDQGSMPTLEHVLEGLPVESIAYAAAVDQWRDYAGVPEDHPDVQAALARHEAARAQLELAGRVESGELESEDAADLDGTNDMTPARELPATVGTYALDPDTEQNGNRRPVSGLQTPEDAAHALRSARAALFDLIDVCHSETELQLLYARWESIWTQPHTERAGARSRQLVEQRQRERPEAALIAALQTAPDTDTLTRLWSQYPRELWTVEAQVLAQRRWEQLTAQAQL
jgi:hypothetical protein